MQSLDYNAGMDYGIGIDTVNGDTRGEAVQRGEPEDIDGASGQEVTTRVVRIETSEELAEAMNISAELSVGFGSFGANAKYDFARETKVNRFSLYFLVSVAVTNAFRQLRDVRLRPEARTLLEAGKAEQFRGRFGDGFVRGLATGGEFYGLIRIDTSSASEKENLSAKLDANYGSFADFKGSFSKSVQSAAEKKQLSIRCLQRGGADTTAPTSAEEMFDKAVGFAPTVAGDKAVPYVALVAGYDTLDLPDAASLVNVQNAREIMAALARQRFMLLGLLNDIDYVVLNASQFAFAPGTKEDRLKELQAQRETVRDLFESYSQATTRCANDFTQCMVPEHAVQMPTIELPGRLDGTAIPQPVPVPTPTTSHPDRNRLPLKVHLGHALTDVAKAPPKKATVMVKSTAKNVVTRVHG